MIEDSDLVRRCLSGDERAFEPIIQKYQKVVYNLALRMGAGTQDAEDITQSVFVKIYERLNLFDPKYKFFSWLYRIALNESINFFQQRRRLDQLDEDIVANEKAPDESYRETELREQIQESLMRLKVDHRVVIILNHFQDLSYHDMSYILDIPEKTVKARLFTARQQLRDILLKRRVLND